MERNGRRPGADPLATDIAALEAGFAAIRVLVAALRLRLALKANFDPNQPRVPPGHGRQSGRWTDAPGGAAPPGAEPPRKPVPIERPPGSAEPAGEKPTRLPPRRDFRRPSGDNPTITITKPSARFPEWSEPTRPPRTLQPMEPPPELPRERPADARVRNRVIVSVAKWAAKMALRSALGPMGHVLTAIEIASWLAEAYPYFRAYFDGPKSLADLHAGVANPRQGYDVHHIVERTPALVDGFPVELVDGPDNLVLIPTLKHWEVTAWFMRPHPALNWQAPRAYLRRRSWAERTRIGLLALVENGVLEP